MEKILKINKFLLVLFFFYYNLDSFFLFVFSFVSHEEFLLYLSSDICETFATVEEIRFYNALVKEINSDLCFIFNFLLPSGNFEFFSTFLSPSEWHSWWSPELVYELEINENEQICKIDFDNKLAKLKERYFVIKDFIHGYPKMIILLILLIIVP